MTDGALSGVADAVEQMAGGLADVERVADVEAATVELRRAGQAFVRLDAVGAHFRLDPVVGAAARRTPGAGASQLGADWVCFRPTALDRFTLDRSTSWTELAWRRAGDRDRR